MKYPLSLFSLTLVILWTATSIGAQTLKADYQFQGNMTNSVAGAPSATNLFGTEANSFVTDTVDGYTRQTLRFPFNSGLSVRLPGVMVPGNSYTIVGLFRFDEVTGYRRVGGDNPSEDEGAYILDGRLEGENTANVPFLPNHYIQVVFVRESNGTVRAYRDGTLRLTVNDTNGTFIFNTFFRMFKDDANPPTEASAGNIARLRLFDAPMSTTQVRALDRVANATGGGEQYLLFNSQRDGFSEIYTMNPDGSNQKRLTNNEVPDFNAKWSPDRSKIAFVRQIASVSQIWIMNADGSGQTQLTAAGTEAHAPSWRPDGQKILFSICDSSFVCDLFTMNPDGTAQTPFPLVNTENDEDFATYSPDGSKIAFICSSGGSSFLDDNICVANAAGSGRQNVTNTVSPVGNTTPAFSSNSSQIAFVRYSLTTDITTAEIYRMNSDGAGLIRLTDNIFFDSIPSWSPNGQQIAFQSTREAAFNEIYVMDSSDGGSLQRLTVNSVADAFPDWYRIPGATPTPTNTFTATATATATPCLAGSLDASFDGDGKAITQLSDPLTARPRSVAIQADGRIVVAGDNNISGLNSDFALVRYNTDGSRDMSFDGDGRVFTPVSSSTDEAYAVAIQSDGKIVVAGTVFGDSTNDFAVVRYNSDGTLDMSFDGDGKVITPVGGGGDNAYSLAIQPDGRIVVAGLSNIDFTPNFALVRYNANGTLDSSFDGDGKVVTQIGSIASSAYSVAIQPDGRIVAAGDSYNGSNNDFAVARYQTDGTLDTSFDGDGKATTPVGGGSSGAFSVALQTDGRIVAAGCIECYDFKEPFPDFAVVRYNANGTLDTSFDGDGKVITPVSLHGGEDFARSVAVQTDGRIVAAGFSYDPSSDDFAIVRYNVDGTLDTSFDGDGKVTTTTTADPFDSAYGVAIQTDGRIVAAGISSFRFAAVRYLGQSSCSLTPTNTPTSVPTATATSTPSGPSITGTLTYGNAIGAPTPRFVSNVNVSATGPSNIFTTTIFPNGNYSLSGFQPGTYVVTPTKSGGVNAAISSFDAGRVSQHVAGVNALTGNQLVVADVSGNGTLSSFDAGQIARWVAGVPGFGLTANWIFIPVNRVYDSVTTNITGQDYSALLMGEVSGNWANSAARPEGGSAAPIYLRRSSASPVSSNQASAAVPPAAEPQDSNWRASEKQSFSANRTAEPWVSAGTERTVGVALPNLVLDAGKDIVVPVNVQGVADKGIISYEFDLRYDPSLIQPSSEPVNLSGTVSRGLSVVTNATELGILRVVVYGAFPIEGDGVLLNLRFTTVGAAGSVSTLAVERIMFNEGEAGVMVTDGQVELAE
ncbi:MAG: cohesin domain-containing protein [Pyrinomonadaceae bacterium]